MAHQRAVSANVTWQDGRIGREQRWAATGGIGATLWFTGLSGSGKSTIASGVEAGLVAAGRAAYMLDGDNLRHGINGDLGFTPEARAENVRRVAHLARILADAGVVAVVSLVSPYTADREHARKIHTDDGLPFVEVHVSTSVEECERRDPKGLYARARRGEIEDFTGVSAPYEAPEAPEVEVDASVVSPEASVARVLDALARQTA